MTQLPLPLPHHEAMEADEFLTTPSNQMAMGWVERWPDWNGPVLVIYGPAGCGKTHLSQIFLTRHEATALTIGDLKTTPPDKLLMQNMHFVLDNAQNISGNTAAEEALFHLYNRLRDNNGTVLMTAPCPVAQWGIKLPDLRSRLMAASTVAIESPDDRLMAALLVKQFHDRQIDIASDVIDYILPRVTRTPQALRDLVASLDKASLAENRPITIALARQMLGQT